MEYLSSFYWQQEEPAVSSLVLQHFVYRKGRHPGLFACICTGHPGEEGSTTEQAYFLNGLNCWFQNRGRDLFQRDYRKNTSETVIRLEQFIEQLDREYADYCKIRQPLTKGGKTDFVGLICQEERFLLFYRGKQQAYLLNRRFEQVHCKCLTELSQGGKLQTVEGRMEAGIAILLATEEFGGRLSEKQLRECLSVPEMIKTENVKGRLRELGEEAARKGGKHMGAVLLLTGKQFGRRKRVDSMTQWHE